MQTLDLNYTQAPADLVMPATAQLVTTAVYGAGAMIFIVYALWLARRQKSLLPIYIILGSLLTIYLEPVVDVLGNAIHPQIGQFNFITTNGHPVPWAVFVGYVWYFSAIPLLSFNMMVDRSLTPEFIWKIFAAVAISAAIVEQVPLHYGTWIYYGYQPFKIGYMPVWWVFANTAAVLVPFLMMYKLIPLLKGWRQPLVVGVVPTGAFMGHAAAGWPMYSALGSDTESFSRAAIQFASLASVALALIVVWIMTQLADVRTRREPV